MAEILAERVKNSARIPRMIVTMGWKGRLVYADQNGEHRRSSGNESGCGRYPRARVMLFLQAACAGLTYGKNSSKKPAAIGTRLFFHSDLYILKISVRDVCRKEFGLVFIKREKMITG